jgi:hypothetical protein
MNARAKLRINAGAAIGIMPLIVPQLRRSAPQFQLSLLGALARGSIFGSGKP